MKDIYNPLVSIVVITYNSSRYVLETLESAKNQSYKNIELIISDDCSKDKTIEICNNWLHNNKERFVNTLLITEDKNTGVTANCNRGCMAANGDWIKLIAGDDVLLPNCIESNIRFVENNKDSDIVFSKEKGIGNMKAFEEWPYKDVHLIFERLSYQERFILLCQHSYLPTPTAFLKTETYQELGGYDESIPFLEDRPFWLKLYANNKHICFNNDFTVAYRFSEESVSQKGKLTETRKKFSESQKKAELLYKKYLAGISDSSCYYVKTTPNGWESHPIKKISHYTNIINPFYYQNRKIIQLFKECLSKSK